MQPRLRLFSVVFILAAMFFNCNKSHQDNPKLIVMLVVDQMRADHLTRFKDIYKSGFARLLREGAVFTNAHHDHSLTETAAGHATIATGVFPTHHGIVGNNWFDRNEQKKVYCCEDTAAKLLGYPQSPPEKGRSPNRLLQPTIGDWLKSASPVSKVYGVSLKDRSVILSTGWNADGAYWYSDSDGRMITSRYYAASYTEWVEEFNAARSINRYFDSGWKTSIPPEIRKLARPDSCSLENKGGDCTFPYSFNKISNEPDASYYYALKTTPFIDEIILEFARKLIDQEKLGIDSFTDYLFIGCSAADNIGHEFGPLSQESMDYFLRLDGYLGDFFSYLDERIGRGKYTVVLSSDHGVMPIPEELARQGIEATRLIKTQLQEELLPYLRKAAGGLGISASPIKHISNYDLFLNYEGAARAGVAPTKLNRALVKALKQHRNIADVFTKDELTEYSTADRSFISAYRHSFHPDRCGDLVLRQNKLCLIRKSKYGTTHGSPYEYDTHVPLVFMGSGIAASAINKKVRTIDIAPTLADIVHIQPLHSIDGHSLLPQILNPIK